MNHIQCQLKKNDRYQVSWIPEKYVKIGKYVKLKEDDGWQIIETYSKQESKEVNKRSADYRYQRESSDI